MQFKHLSIEEREIIQEMLWDNKSIRSIAKKLNRSTSSISRELKKSVPLNIHKYNSRIANNIALNNRKSRGRRERLKSEKVREYVKNKLILSWSPEQISGRIKIDLNESISHEAIYQFIYYQIHRDGYGHLKPGCVDYRIHLRRHRKRRQPKNSRKYQRIFKPLDTSIDKRPEYINSRLRFGDWESDTVESCSHLPGVNTLLERKSGFYLISKLKSSTSNETARVIEERMKKLPKCLVKSITFDNGKENNSFQYLKDSLNVRTYHCNPYHSWERGSNENANGLLRQYFPKKTDFTKVSIEEISMVEYLLNTRPRKRLGYLSPLEFLEPI